VGTGDRSDYLHESEWRTAIDRIRTEAQCLRLSSALICFI